MILINRYRHQVKWLLLILMTWVLIVLSPVLTVEGQLQAGPRLGGVGQDVLGLHHAAGGQVAQSAT